MLDIKHRNIGATVSILDKLAGLVGGKELPDELTSLFDLESDECDHKQHGSCFFEEDEPNACISPPQCTITNCPLGEILDVEIEEGHVDLSEAEDKIRG